MMDIYQEYTDVVQEEIRHEHDDSYFSNSIEFEFCECGSKVTSCPDAYEHMSRGF